MEGSDNDQERLEKKYRILSEKLTQRPNSPFLNEHLGDVCLEMGKRDEALERYKKALELDPELDDAAIKLKRNFSPDELKGFVFPKKTLPFWQDLKSVFRYPFAGGGKLIIFIGALIFMIIGFIPIIGFLLLLFLVYPYIVAYMLKILRATARGKKEMPDWPEVSDYWGSILLPYIQVLIAFAISYGPAILITVLALKSFFFFALIFILGLIFGTIYFPMALIAVALHGGALVPLNFHLLVESIWKIKTDYIIGLIVIGALMIIEFIVQILFIRIPLVGPYIFWVITLYFAAVLMYILGNIYHVNKKVLNWF